MIITVIGGDRGASVDIGRVSAPIAGTDVVSTSCCPCAKLKPKRVIKNDIDSTAA
jgi:hypothetical protein